jgi:tRNA pseudouridine32 synthase / 23S rRNA pseudouridine746 synthase
MNTLLTSNAPHRLSPTLLWLLQLSITSNFAACLSITSDNFLTTNQRSNYFRTERNVVIRSVPWCGGILPLQIYSGMSLPLESIAQKQQPYKESEQVSKESAEERASRPLDPNRHLHILYNDADICVVHKPSGVLCVPGPRRNPSLANLVYDVLQPLDVSIDQMVVHRLDMDTSGIVVFALTERALKQLHHDFRNRIIANNKNSNNENIDYPNRVYKTYEALVCGHMIMDEGDIDLALERDPTHIPFMRVCANKYPPEGVTDEISRLSLGTFAKFIDKAPKPSFTTFRVLSRHYLHGKYPVTRVELKPVTGRTHQLRVHCAAIGHPILGDDIYGIGGEGSINGGLTEGQQSLFSCRASLSLQYDLLRNVNTRLCLHAKRLCIYHPFSGAPMIFEAKANF